MKLNTKKIENELSRIGWTKYRLAKEMNVAHQWIYQVLNPKYNGHTLRTIERIAVALGFDGKDLII